MTEDIRQCWAFNTNYQRCDMPAGHPGNHAITATWTDEECSWAKREDTTKVTIPNPHSVTIPGTPGLLVTDMSEPAQKKDIPKCAACSHAHKGGPCKCGCYEYIG